jgi:hypothetical protein
MILAMRAPEIDLPNRQQQLGTATTRPDHVPILHRALLITRRRELIEFLGERLIRRIDRGRPFSIARAFVKKATESNR